MACDGHDGLTNRRYHERVFFLVNRGRERRDGPAETPALLYNHPRHLNHRIGTIVLTTIIARPNS